MTRFIGGATVPHSSGGAMSVSWPMVVLEINEATLAIKFRAPWVRSLARLFSFGRSARAKTADDLNWWVARVDDVSLVRVGPRSILINGKVGDCSFGSPRFLPSSQVKIEKLRTELELLRINVEAVHSKFIARFSMKSGNE
jgi:hypothetical protein